LLIPDGRGKAGKVTVDMVRQTVEVAKELKAKGQRLRIKSFTKELQMEHNISLSAKKVTEILIANGLYKASSRRRRPRFYQRLRQSIPNGLISADGSEFTVYIDNVGYKFNLELGVDVESFCHSAFSVSDTETAQEFIKVMEKHKNRWGTPIGIVSDHGSGNLSDEAMAYLKRNDIEILPAGPGNAKGNGTCEVAFSEMKKVIGPIKLETSSLRDLAKAILEKIISVYIAMRNRLARLGDKIPPEEAIKAPVSGQQRRHEKERQKDRKKHDDPSRQAKVDRLDWIITHHNLQVDEQSLKRAQRCIISYELDAIGKSEEAFLKAIRRDQQRRSLAYFFGILKRIADEMDASRYQGYFYQRYNYQQMIDRERQKREQINKLTTVEDLVAILQRAVRSRFGFIKETCIRQAKRMAENLKKQHRYMGVLKGKISDALGDVKELDLDQRKEVLELVEELLT